MKFAVIFAITIAYVDVIAGASVLPADLDFYEEDNAWYDFSQSVEEDGNASWLKTFKDVKKAAFSGKQLEAVVHVDLCQRQRTDYDLPINAPPGLKATFIQKFNVWQWMIGYKSVYNNEVIVFPARQTNSMGTFTNEEFLLLSNGTLIWALSTIGQFGPVLVNCSLGRSVFFRSPDQTRKSVKSAADAQNIVLGGKYDTNIIAVVDYSKCDLLGNIDSPINVVNGGIIEEHLLYETGPSGPLEMVSNWVYLTQARANQMAAAGTDFHLSWNNTVIVDAFHTAPGGQGRNGTVDARFRCTLTKGIDYYY